MSGNHLSDSKTITLNTIEDAIEAIRNGEIIIVVDDEDRENEGDFICAAEMITPEVINFMATFGRGLICTPLEESRVKELELTMMVNNNTALHETAFTVSIDYTKDGCTTGISAYDRATGIKKLVDPETKANDYARPGHIFPLRAVRGGVLRRTGHTEAAVDLARLAGFYPAGVLVEILNEDGSMARLPQLRDIANKHNLKLISIADLIAYRLRTEKIIRKEYETKVETKYGVFDVVVYEQLSTLDKHLIIRKGHWEDGEPVLVRAHSLSATFDILGSLFDDYALYMHKAFELLNKEEKGMLLFMRHQTEGKGDLVKQILSFKNKNEHKEKGDDMSQRNFGVGAQILRDQGVSKIRLITNNPKRRIGLIGHGLEIVENIEMDI